MEGWIKIHRQFLDWEWWDDKITSRLFLYLLVMANHKDNKWKGVTIKRGQLVTGSESMRKGTGFSRQQIRTALNKLKSTNEITNRTTNQYTLITITNYESYQTKATIDKPTEQPVSQPSDNQRATNEQPTDNHKQERKNIKNDNNINTTIGIGNENSDTSQENSETNNKNKKEKEKKSAAKKKKKTLIASITSPLPRTEDNRHLRLAYSVWHLLKPHHGHQITFKGATLEKWGADLKRLMNKGAEAVEIHKLVKWVLANKPDSIPFLQSPNHLIKNEYLNYSRLVSLMERSDKKSQEIVEDKSKAVYTPPPNKIFKPDNV